MESLEPSTLQVPVMPAGVAHAATGMACAAAEIVAIISKYPPTKL